MLECSPRDSIILDVVDPSRRYRMFLFGKVPALRAGWQTWPESKADQGDWKRNGAFYEGSDFVALKRKDIIRIMKSHLHPARP